MEKKDLKWPMWGKLRDGSEFCMEKFGCVATQSDTFTIDYYDDDLKFQHFQDFDIMEVYGLEISTGITINPIKYTKMWDLSALIWEREERMVKIFFDDNLIGIIPKSKLKEYTDKILG